MSGALSSDYFPGTLSPHTTLNSTTKSLLPSSALTSSATVTNVRALNTVMDARKAMLTPQEGGGGVGGGYAQFEPSKGPPPVIAIPTIPEIITLCRNPFHPHRSNCLWFQPADQPWDGDKSPLTMQFNPTTAAMKRHMRTAEGPLIAVVPHSIDPNLIPNHQGPLMKLSRTKNSKSFGAMLFNIPDGAVRLTTLMTILKMSGMRELMAGEVMEKFLAKYEKLGIGGGGGASGAKGTKNPPSSSLSGGGGANALFRQASEEYRAILKETAEGSEEREEALEAFALMRLAESPAWSLRWCKRMTSVEYMLLEPYQRVNHFPGTWGIGRKDRLHKNLCAAADRFGKEHYSFHPEGWLLPQDAEALQKDMAARLHPPPGQSRNVYIVKRVAGARGQRMHLLQKAKVPKGTWIAQRYIHDPFLIDGFKFDLRIYVAVTSYDPLRVYVYEEGVVRFATSKYPKYTAAAAEGEGEGDREGKKSRTFKVKDVAAHLTNYSINKKSKNFVNPTEGEEAANGNDSGNDDDGDDDDETSGSDDEEEEEAEEVKKPAAKKGSKPSTSKQSKKKAGAAASGSGKQKRRPSSVDEDEEGDDDDDEDAGDSDGGDATKTKSNKPQKGGATVSERGSKWVISTLRRYLEQHHGVAWEPLWARIEDLIIKTLISVEPTVNHVMRQIFPSVSGLAATTAAPTPNGSSGGGGGGGGSAAASSSRLPFTCYSHPAGSNVHSCFELYGFDVLLREEDLSPVLMEVNIMPSLESNASLLDQRVKGNMVADLLTLVGAGFSAKKAYRCRIPTDANPYHAEVVARLQREKEAKAQEVAAAVAAAMGGGGGGSGSNCGAAVGGIAAQRRSSSLGVSLRRPSNASSASQLSSASGNPSASQAQQRSSSRSVTNTPSSMPPSPPPPSNACAIPIASSSARSSVGSRAGAVATIAKRTATPSSSSSFFSTATSSKKVSTPPPPTPPTRSGGNANASAAKTSGAVPPPPPRSASRSTTTSASVVAGGGVGSRKAVVKTPTQQKTPSSPLKASSAPKVSTEGGGGGGGSEEAIVKSLYDFHPYFRSRTPAEMDVICTAEEELSRRQHWKRLFPTAAAYDTYSRFFPEQRSYNVVLSEWEKEKLKNPPSWIIQSAGGGGDANNGAALLAEDNGDEDGDDELA